MKIILVICLLSISLFSSEIKWSTNYNMARYKATKDNKKVLLFISAKNNPFSEIMKEDTFTHPDVVDIVNKHYVAIELSLGLDKMPVGIKTFSAPSVYFMTSKGKEICRHIVGEVSPKRMVKVLKEALISCEVR